MKPFRSLIAFAAVALAAAFAMPAAAQPEPAPAVMTAHYKTASQDAMPMVDVAASQAAEQRAIRLLFSASDHSTLDGSKTPTKPAKPVKMAAGPGDGSEDGDGETQGMRRLLT